MRSVQLLVRSFLKVMNENPWMALLWVSCLVGGTAAGVVLLSEPYGLARAIFGGVLGGVGTGLFLSINRLIG